MTQPIIAVVFNAPPRAGKDTLARLLPKYLSGSVRTDCFKRTLFEATEKRVIDEVWDAIPPAFWGSVLYDDLKDDPDYSLTLDDGFEGTVREALIHVSEDICKPKYGQDYFGKQLAKDLKPGYNLITDGGFVEEYPAVEAAADYTIVVQFDRANCNFDNDSRDFLACEEGLSVYRSIPEGESPTKTAEWFGIHFAHWERCNADTRRMAKAVPAPYLETFS